MFSSNFNDIKSSMKIKLNRILINIKDIKPQNITRIKLISFDDTSKLDYLKDKKGFKYIYIISANTPCDIRKAFDDAKKNNSDRKYAKDNDSKLAPYTLYVGSSQNIYARLNNHIFGNYKKTYSMHMNTWFKEEFGSIYIQCIEFDKNINNDILQLIEDTYWEQLQPMFGKQGKQ